MSRPEPLPVVLLHRHEVVREALALRLDSEPDLAVVASVALYVVFERLFQVALPHGWLGAVLDL